jgi:tellurite resistance protein TerC
VDNLFVFVMLFAFFKADGKQELKALQWGIYGAMVLRLLFILAGVGLISTFHWVIYLFGALLLWTAWKMQFSGDAETDPNNMWLVRTAKKLFPVTDQYHGTRFFVRLDGKRWATPLLILVVAVESSDVMFAVDSIPAILSITTDPFIVFSSNIFAILGLRALFFLLARMMQAFRYLKTGVTVILAFVGVKMLLAAFVHIPVSVSLGVIAAVMAAAVVASLLAKPGKAKG